MRISDNYFFNTFKQRQQNSLGNITTVSNQLASGRKIQDSFDNSSIYTDVMRLDYEEATMEQVKTSTSKGEQYVQNTDSVLTQLTDSLDQFKQKLIQASNQSNSQTSLDAIAKDLKGLRNHMVSLANTSINGQYIFSGSALQTKPITDSGDYQGNDQIMNTVLGFGVELPYNIDGESLFLGRDTDYKKIISTNVGMKNEILLHPLDDNIAPKEEYLTLEHTVRDMFGDSDRDDTNDSDAVFYISGRKSDGETFGIKLQEAPSTTIKTLLEDIGALYGNTDDTKYVNVELNKHGQIEITDLKNGNTVLDFSMVGAKDLKAGVSTVGDADQADMNDLLKQVNVDIKTFTKSNFHPSKVTSTVSSSRLFYDQDTYKVNDVMKFRNGTNAEQSDNLRLLLGSNVTNLEFTGTRPDGTLLDDGVAPANEYNFAVGANSTVKDLLDEIGIAYNGTVVANIKDGQIILSDLTSPVGTGNVTFSMKAEDAAGGNEVKAFSGIEGFVTNNNLFDKETNRLTSNVSQYIKSSGEYATGSTKILDVAGVNEGPNYTLDGKSLKLNLTDIAGNNKDATIDFKTAGSTFSVDSNGDGVVETYDIFDANGNVVKADEMTYLQLNDVVSMLIANKMPTDTNASGAIGFVEYKDALNLAKGMITVSLDYRGRMTVEDLVNKNATSAIELSIYEPTGTTFLPLGMKNDGAVLSFNSNNALTIQNSYIDFFKEIDEMIVSIETGKYRADGDTFDNKRNVGLQNALTRIDHLSDHITKKHTEAGALQRSMQYAYDRSNIIQLNVIQTRSLIFDTDMGEALMKFQQLQNNYQAMLSTTAKISQMSLLQYM